MKRSSGFSRKAAARPPRKRSAVPGWPPTKPVCEVLSKREAVTLAERRMEPGGNRPAHAPAAQLHARHSPGDLQTARRGGQGPGAGRAGPQPGAACGPRVWWICSICRGCIRGCRSWSCRHRRKAPGKRLVGHMQEITAVAVGYQVKAPRILSASTDGTVRVWDLKAAARSGFCVIPRRSWQWPARFRTRNLRSAFRARPTALPGCGTWPAPMIGRCASWPASTRGP